MKPTILKPCDLFFTCGDSKVSKAIRWFTRQRKEDKSLVNHVGLVIVGGTLSESEIIEAVKTVQSGKLVSRYGPPKKDRFAVYRPNGLTASQRESIVLAAKRYEGRRYGYHMIAANALDLGLTKLAGRNVYFFRRFAGMVNYPMCSWLAAHSFEKAGISFGRPVDSADPDDLWDWVVGHPDQFTQVRPLLPLVRSIDAQGRADIVLAGGLPDDSRA